jgi:hypothetical protein
MVYGTEDYGLDEEAKRCYCPCLFGNNVSCTKIMVLDDENIELWVLQSTKIITFLTLEEHYMEENLLSNISTIIFFYCGTLFPWRF